jgi:hypothetical protein
MGEPGMNNLQMKMLQPVDAVVSETVVDNKVEKNSQSISPEQFKRFLIEIQNSKEPFEKLLEVTSSIAISPSSWGEIRILTL